MRLNKYLSYNGICSRRKADLLIKNKKILINKKYATFGMNIINKQQNIIINNKKIIIKKKKYIIII